MDEKKNFTPNAIEDDKLDEVAGGRSFSFGKMGKQVGDMLKRSIEQQEAEEEQQP